MINGAYIEPFYGVEERQQRYIILNPEEKNFSIKSP
jgi:hypothetical protein